MRVFVCVFFCALLRIKSQNNAGMCPCVLTVLAYSKVVGWLQDKPVGDVARDVASDSWPAASYVYPADQQQTQTDMLRIRVAYSLQRREPTTNQHNTRRLLHPLTRVVIFLPSPSVCLSARLDTHTTLQTNFWSDLNLRRRLGCEK